MNADPDKHYEEFPRNGISDQGLQKPLCGQTPSADHSAQNPHVHIAGMDLIKTPSIETFATRKVYEQGQLVYLWDAKDYSREFLGHCFARPWKAAKARYDTIFSLFRDILHVAPSDCRFYGVF